MKRAERWVLVLLPSVSIEALPDVVDNTRLLAAQKGSGGWLSYGHDYSNQRFYL